MRDQMEGVAAASEGEMAELAMRFQARLRAVQPDPATRSVFVLFKDVDQDGSGRITYDEFLKVVRVGLAMKAAELPEGELKSLWLALDNDASGAIDAGEFGSFMRRSGAPDAEALHGRYMTVG